MQRASITRSKVSFSPSGKNPGAAGGRRICPRPVCIAKTQYSMSDNAALRGAPEGYTLTVRSARLSAGAGFVVAFAGSIIAMPGLPKVPPRWASTWTSKVKLSVCFKQEREDARMQNLQMELLQILKEDCRLPLEKLAVMTGATMETVAEAIQEMERTGVILRYSPVINWIKPTASALRQ